MPGFGEVHAPCAAVQQPGAKIVLQPAQLHADGGLGPRQPLGGTADTAAFGGDDEGPQRPVTIARPFAVGKFEVTRGEFETFVRESGRAVGDKCWTWEGGQWQERAGRSFRKPGFAQDVRHPAVCVNWEDAQAFAVWLSRKTGKIYRLLTEAEWEYAARAGSTTRYHFGDSEQDLCTYGNVADQPHWQYAFRPGVSSSLIGCNPCFGAAIRSSLVRVDPSLRRV